MILYIIRVFLALSYLLLVAFIGAIACLFRPFNPNNLEFLVHLISKGSILLGIKVIVRNRHLMKEFPSVFIANHQENMDVFIGSHVFPYRTVTVGKRSLIYIPIFGLFYWLSGNILIDRQNRTRAHGAIDFAAKQITDKNISIWILPEGTRSKGRGLLPFKKGAFVTAIKAQVPVTPVVISSYHTHLNLKKWKAGTVIVEVLPPISTKNMTMENVNELKDLAFDLISRKVSELDQELA